MKRECVGENWTEKGMRSTVGKETMRMGMKNRGREKRLDSGREMNCVWREKRNEGKKKDRKGEGNVR